MRRLLRIPIGLALCPVLCLIGTCMWLFEEDTDWAEEVGTAMWYLASGQWSKLPD